MEGHICRCCTAYPPDRRGDRAAGRTPKPSRGAAGRRRGPAVSDEHTVPDGIELEPERYELDGASPTASRSAAAASSACSAASLVLVAAPPGSEPGIGRAGRAEGQGRPTSRPGFTSRKTAASPSSPARSSSAERADVAGAGRRGGAALTARDDPMVMGDTTSRPSTWARSAAARRRTWPAAAKAASWRASC